MVARIPLPKDEIARFCRRHHIQRLALFGSVLRDDFRADSDVDVLVQFEPDRTPGWEFFGMQDELTQILGRKVDLNTPGFLSRYSATRSWPKPRPSMSARDAAIPLRHMRDAARRAIEIAQPTLARPPRLRVEVLHGPEVAMQAVLFLDGDPIGLMFLDEGPVSALAAGDYEVSLWGDAADEVRRQRVRVADAGETRVVFDLAARR